MRSLENSSAGQRGELGNLAGRMREMKEVVLTLGRRKSKPLRTSAASTQADTEVSVPTQADPAGVGRNENIHPGSTSVADRPTARNLLAPYPPATGAEVPINVDFETAMDQMFLSLDEMQIPVSASAATLSSGRHRSSSTIPLVPPHSPQPAVVTAGSHAGGRPVTVTSLSKVDERLEELKAEKERLRELLLSRVDRP